VSRQGANLVELTVIDAGVGIAATLNRSIDIYSGPLEDERRCLQDAMTMDGTRYGPGSGAGIGFPAMLEATRKSDGVILVRSGRLSGYRHFLADEESDTPPANLASLITSEEALTMVQGTTVTLLLVVPFRSEIHSDQLALEVNPAASAIAHRA
jgi:hypothetical protein